MKTELLAKTTWNRADGNICTFFRRLPRNLRKELVEHHMTAHLMAWSSLREVQYCEIYQFSHVAVSYILFKLFYGARNWTFAKS